MYISKQDIIDRIGERRLVELTDPENVSGAVNDVRVAKAISYAAGVFDSYALQRYQAPIVATDTVKSLNLDLCLYDFYKDTASFDEGIWKVRKAAHDDAIKLLQAIGRGLASLEGQMLITAPASGGTSEIDGWSGVVAVRPVW